MKKIKKIAFCYFIFMFFCIIINFILFFKLYISKSVPFNLAITPFDIYEKYPVVWLNIKYAYILVAFIAYTIIFKSTIFKILSKFQIQENIKQNNENEEKLKLKIGTNKNGDLVNIEEQGLYQNIIVTGTIGSGKTSSAMYPFTRQLIAYKADSKKEKLGLLILDVKGNYHKQVEKYCILYGRQKDLIVLSLDGNIRYNPLDKPNLKAHILANRLKTILTLFSSKNGEQYWLDKAEH